MKRQGDQLSQESPSTGVRRIRPHTVRNPRINSQPALCIQALPSADSTKCRPCSMYLLGKKKKSIYKWTHAVQTHIHGSTVLGREKGTHENKEGAIREISGASREYSVTGDKGAVLEKKQ